MRLLFRVSMSILTGFSTYFAFPIILALVERLLELRIYQYYSLFPTGFILLFAPCVVVPFPVYYALTSGDVKKIHIPKNTQAIIVFVAAVASLATFIVLGGTQFEGRPTSLLLWYIALLLNFFFFSAVILSSLYYLIRTALALKSGQT